MNSEQISSLEGFLNYGPIGLAGLMLVLVVIALSMRELTEVKAGLLKFFMVVGALCFALSILAPAVISPGSYRMNVAVVPGNLDETPHASPPALQIDGEAFAHGTPHLVDKDFSILIDLTSTVSTAEAAMEEIRAALQADLDALEARTAAERAALEDQLETVATEMEKFQAIQAMLSDLQSNSPNIDVLKISRQLNSEVERFMSNLGDVVAAVGPAGE